MGADWYSFTSITVAAIPVPKEALQQPFDLHGFNMMTVHHECYDRELDEWCLEYHGAMICLADTEWIPTSIDVIGPYEITDRRVECKRMKHLDVFMPADTRDRLISAFETYTGRKPDDVPGFWTMSTTNWYLVDLHTTWSLGAGNRIASGDCDGFCFLLEWDADGSHA